MSEHTQSGSTAQSGSTQSGNVAQAGTMPRSTVTSGTPATQVAGTPLERSTRSKGQWVVAAVIAIVAALIFANSTHFAAQASGVVPQSTAMESALGVRFARVAVVGDGGLITVNYVVLDSQKASRFQDDRAHAPVLYSEARDGSTKRVSLMKQGHDLRPGQTYYLVYENTAGALRAGEQVTITVGNLELHHVPVL